ncbi:MAG: hypothetical protein P8L47_03165 [Candidatus Marinamargulisbacteria bacterium]|nr:hypothetical protein [Candidatus Marinamargulisbacteria bacterium]
MMELCVSMGVMAMVIGLPWYGRISIDLPVVYQQVVLARMVSKTHAKRTVIHAHSNRIHVADGPNSFIRTLAVASPVSHNRPVGFTYNGRTSRAGTITVGSQGRVTVGVGFGQVRMRP